jgi:recombination protein RecA
MASIAVIRTQVERRLPGAFSVYRHASVETFPTGIVAIDREIGGIAQSVLTQICVPKEMSSGKSAMLNSLVAQLTRQEHFCALVDASDCFDPVSADAAGVDLSRVLWVRCGEWVRYGEKKLKPLEQAFKAADILVQNGGFGLIAVDLGNIDERHIRKIPLTTWFRFARVIEKMPAALVFLTTYPVAQSCAGMTLHMKSATPSWSGTVCASAQSHVRALAELSCEVEIGRSRLRKPVQSARPKFTAAPVWA